MFEEVDKVGVRSARRGAELWVDENRADILDEDTDEDMDEDMDEAEVVEDYIERELLWDP